MDVLTLGTHSTYTFVYCVHKGGHTCMLANRDKQLANYGYQRLLKIMYFYLWSSQFHQEKNLFDLCGYFIITVGNSEQTNNVNTVLHCMLFYAFHADKRDSVTIVSCDDKMSSKSWNITVCWFATTHTPFE